MEFESFYSGTLLHIGIQEGETAPVDAVLAIIGPEGTDVSSLVKSGGASKKAAPKKSEEKQEDTKEEDQKDSGSATTSDGARIFASPLAKKMAEDLGIDLSTVKGSGENNRIVKKDIESYKPSEKAAEAKPATAPQQEEKAQPSAAQTYILLGKKVLRKSRIRKCVKPLPKDLLNQNTMLLITTLPLRLIWPMQWQIASRSMNCQM